MSLTNRSILPAAVLMLVAGTVGLRATSSRNDIGNVYASRTVVIHSIFGNDPNAQYIVEYLWGDTVTAPPHPPRPSRAP